MAVVAAVAVVAEVAGAVAVAVAAVEVVAGAVATAPLLVTAAGRQSLPWLSSALLPFIFSLA